VSLVPFNSRGHFLSPPLSLPVPLLCLAPHCLALPCSLARRNACTALPTVPTCTDATLYDSRRASRGPASSLRSKLLRLGS
jgi:hypothetical protein